jgi:hypothetical protein
VVGAFEIILQGAFEQAGDLISVVADLTTPLRAKQDAANLNLYSPFKTSPSSELIVMGAASCT